jgi:hypothetical protein
MDPGMTPSMFVAGRTGCIASTVILPADTASRRIASPLQSAGGGHSL